MISYYHPVRDVEKLPPTRLLSSFDFLTFFAHRRARRLSIYIYLYCNTVCVRVRDDPQGGNLCRRRWRGEKIYGILVHHHVQSGSSVCVCGRGALSLSLSWHTPHPAGTWLRCAFWWALYKIHHPHCTRVWRAVWIFFPPKRSGIFFSSFVPPSYQGSTIYKRADHCPFFLSHSIAFSFGVGESQGLLKHKTGVWYAQGPAWPSWNTVTGNYSFWMKRCILALCGYVI